MDKCIFCMIASGELEKKTLLEDDLVVAFDDIMPQAPSHSLVITKEHFANLSDAVPAQALGRLLEAAAEVAKIKGIDRTGYRVIINNGPHSNQTIGHLHAHVMGGKLMSHGMVTFADGS